MKKVCCALLFGITSLCASDIETITKTEGVLSSKQLSYFKELFKLHSFIETGTFSGNTTEQASKVFEEVHSIEIWEPLYLSAEKRFSAYPHVSLYFGDTTKLLSQMIENSSAKRLYWLDAHSSGEGTGGLPGFSPIPQELDQILSDQGDIDSVILIDDLRGMCHCDNRTNLPLRLMIQQLEEINPDLEFYSIGDIGVIFNRKTYPFITISQLVKSASISRFFDPQCEDESLLEELIDAESFIASCNEESEEGKNFCQLINWVNRNCLGGEVVYLLWEALRKLETKDYPSAIHDLQLITNSFYTHWRIDAYLVKALLLNGQTDQALSLFNDKLLHPCAKHPKIIDKIINNNNQDPIWIDALN